MPSARPRRRRLLLPTLIAATLALEVTGFAIARSAGSSDGVTRSPAVPGVAVADARLERSLSSDRSSAASPGAAPHVIVSHAARPTPNRSTMHPHPAASTSRARSTSTSRARSVATQHAVAYHGRNHVWIPSLGISAGIQSFPCSRSRPPDAGVYRWGCAGTNNVYLLGHAWSTFRPLHDAYVRGRLRRGVAVWYADPGSRVHEYRVAWWRVVAPTSAASWAWAALSRPSMTLQTCVGANSEYRLMVRLVQVH